MSLQRSFCSLDRQTRCNSAFVRPDRYRDLFRSLHDGRSTIAAGACLSYVAASFGNDSLTVSMTKFNRILAFSREARTIEVEAGMAIGSLTEFLARHQLLLPVQPGYPAITIGGCVAANIHGKNPRRDGLFSSCVVEVKLYHPSHGEMRCSNAENAEVFALTLGGLGLTGVILSATLNLSPLTSNVLDVKTTRFENLRDGCEMVEAESMNCHSVVAWVNLGNRGPRWGSGLLSSFMFSSEKAGVPTKAHDPGFSKLDPSLGNWPGWPVIMTWTMPLINFIYERSQKGKQTAQLWEALYPSLGKEIYYDLYGERGFFEFQSLVPKEALSSLFSEVEPRLKASDVAIGLATIKSFQGKDRHIDFNGRGVSFTLDIPASAAASPLLDFLEQWASSSGVKVNPIKYSRLTGPMLRKQYPEAELFHDRLLSYDPSRRFKSALSERLEL